MRNLPREFYIPQHSTKIADKASDAIAYISQGSHGRPVAALFWGKQAKPIWHYNFRSEAEREKTIREGFQRRQEGLASKAEYQATRLAKNAVARAGVKVGDIYRTCWGYDQTNVEFFEVVEVKGAYATLREIACASEGGGPGGEKVVAQSGAFLEPRYEGDDRGKPIRRLIQDGHIKIDECRTGWPWGKRVAGVVVGSACHRTAFGYGH